MEDPMGSMEDLARAFASVREGRELRALIGHLDTEAAPPRLYAGLDLDVYVELPELVSYSRDADPLGPTVAWVPAQAELTIRFVGEPPKGVRGLDVDDLFRLQRISFGTEPGGALMRGTCKYPPWTSHTIGWCATD
jgi:hypothetical protein